MRAIFGADPLYEGEIYVNGRRVVNKSPEDALANGIGLISEDRKREGFIPSMDNRMNMNMAVLKDFRYKGFLNQKGLLANFEKFAESVHLNIRNPEHLTKNLSGGNQQKVIVAKWLATNVDLLIFDEPTKGVDVGAKSEIYKLMEEFVASGKTIIMVSSEMTEVIGMSDRIIVMREGHITGELTDKSEFEGEIILAHAMEETKK